MPRPSRSLDPNDGPVQAFAAELRKLRSEAGDPKFLQMARKTGKSRTALAEACGGDHLASWETVAAFVAACNADPKAWRQKWERARDARAATDRSKLTAGRAADTEPSGPAPEHQVLVSAPQPKQPRRRTLAFGLSVLITAVIASGITTGLFVGLDSDASPHRALIAMRAAVITVQNKVALGPHSLVEDTTPSFLSAKPVPYCAEHGCEVPGTQVSSGAQFVAVCYTDSVQMWNYNLDSTASQHNPYRASSRLWYKVIYPFPGGRAGYISAVYIVAADRGGMGLPRCKQAKTNTR